MKSPYAQKGGGKCDMPYKGGSKPSHLKHVPDHMLESKHGDHSASMTHATLQGRAEGGDEPEAA